MRNSVQIPITDLTLQRPDPDVAKATLALQPKHRTVTGGVHLQGYKQQIYLHFSDNLSI
jgi:hypothetical protein